MDDFDSSTESALNELKLLPLRRSFSSFKFAFLQLTSTFYEQLCLLEQRMTILANRSRAFCTDDRANETT